MRFLKQNTAVVITVGPAIDHADGLTPLDALTVANLTGLLTYDDDDGSAPNSTVGAHFHPAASASDNDMVSLGACGMWSLELTAANVNFTGRAMLCLTDPAQMCPIFHEFQVLAANVYDSLFAGVGPTADLLDVNAAQHLGTAYHATTIAGVPIVQQHTTGGGVDGPTTSYPANFEHLSITDTTGLVATAATQHVIVDSGTVTTLTNLPAAAATAAELAKVPKSDSTVSWNATALAAINAEVDTALNTAIPGSPTADSINERVATMDAKVAYLPDAAPLDEAGLRTAIGLGSANLDTQLAALPTDADVNAACDTAISDAALATAAQLPALAFTTGTVATSGGNNTATSFYTNLAGADDFWIDCLILITSGALSGQVKEIGDFADANGVVTLTSGQTFTGTPADGVTFTILNR